MKKPIKPTKKSITEELAKNNFWKASPLTKANLVTTFPCPDCRETGRIHDPNDSPDPVEGYKMVNKITCPLCQGKTVIPKAAHSKIISKEVNSAYSFAMKLYNQDLLKYNTLQSILKKCSPKEKFFLLKFVL